MRHRARCLRRIHDAAIGLALLAATGGVLPAFGAPIDVSGMRAIYDEVTGNLRFEGLWDIHGVGIAKAPSATLHFAGANHASPTTVAYEEEVGWLFMDGIAGGAFDSGHVLPPGLTDGLSDYFIGVARMGSGLDVTPIPIERSGTLYAPNFNPLGDMAPPPAPPEPNPDNFRAIYDGATGAFRFEGLEGVRQVQIARSGEQPFQVRHINNSIPLVRDGTNRVQWIVADAGLSAFDAGVMFPAGLDHELGKYFVQVDGWPLPITAGDVEYASTYASMADVEATWLPGTEVYDPWHEYLSQLEADPPLPEDAPEYVRNPPQLNPPPTDEPAGHENEQFVEVPPYIALPGNEGRTIAYGVDNIVGFDIHDAWRLVPFVDAGESVEIVSGIVGQPWTTVNVQSTDYADDSDADDSGLSAALREALARILAGESAFDADGDALPTSVTGELADTVAFHGSPGIGPSLVDDVTLVSFLTNQAIDDGSPIPEPGCATLALLCVAAVSRRRRDR